MVDESTNRALELHLITYVMYLKNDGIGKAKIGFSNLVTIPYGTMISIFKVWKTTRIKYDFASKQPCWTYYKKRLHLWLL